MDINEAFDTVHGNLSNMPVKYCQWKRSLTDVSAVNHLMTIGHNSRLCIYGISKCVITLLSCGSS